MNPSRSGFPDDWASGRSRAGPRSNLRWHFQALPQWRFPRCPILGQSEGSARGPLALRHADEAGPLQEVVVDLQASAAAGARSRTQRRRSRGRGVVQFRQIWPCSSKPGPNSTKIRGPISANLRQVRQISVRRPRILGTKMWSRGACCGAAWTCGSFAHPCKAKRLTFEYSLPAPPLSSRVSF